MLLNVQNGLANPRKLLQVVFGLSY